MSNSNYTMSADDLINNAEGTGFKQAITDGVYGGVVVGYTVVKSVFKDKQTGNDVESIGAKLIIQIKDDEGKPAIITTSALKASLHEKAGLRAMMASWLKKSDPKSIVDAMVAAGIVKDGVFSWGGFIGRKPAVMIKMVAGKKDATKLYPQVSSVIPCKADQAIEPTVMEIPAFIFDGSLESQLMDGFKVKPKKADAVKQTQNQASQKVDLPGFGTPEQTDNPDIPF